MAFDKTRFQMSLSILASFWCCLSLVAGLPPVIAASGMQNDSSVLQTESSAKRDQTETQDSRRQDSRRRDLLQQKPQRQNTQLQNTQPQCPAPDDQETGSSGERSGAVRLGLHSPANSLPLCRECDLMSDASPQADIALVQPLAPSDSPGLPATIAAAHPDYEPLIGEISQLRARLGSVTGDQSDFRQAMGEVIQERRGDDTAFMSADTNRLGANSMHRQLTDGRFAVQDPRLAAAGLVRSPIAATPEAHSHFPASDHEFGKTSYLDQHNDQDITYGPVPNPNFQNPYQQPADATTQRPMPGWQAPPSHRPLSGETSYRTPPRPVIRQARQIQESNENTRSQPARNSEASNFHNGFSAPNSSHNFRSPEFSPAAHAAEMNQRTHVKYEIARSLEMMAWKLEALNDFEAADRLREQAEDFRLRCRRELTEPGANSSQSRTQNISQ